MDLCHICKSIQWQSLPPFPEELYARNATGLQHVHNLFPSATLTREQRTARVNYHGSFADLRGAAAAGCQLCLSVKDEADALVAEIEGLEGIQREMEGSLPTFDMWLTKRPVGGDGFWILSETQQDAELVSESEPPSTLVIAAFGFSAVEGSSLATEFRGRPIKELPDASVFSLIKRWVSECNAKHECFAMNPVLPRRLIDVELLESEGNASVKIVGFEQGEVGNYTALSYSRERGIGQDLATPVGFSGNCPTRTITSLPKVFQDAILLTRHLGIRYLWIDALCIPGGQFDASERDSAAFAGIYEKAYLTLAATGANDGLQGLFFPRTSVEYIRTPHKTNDGISGDLWLHKLPLTREFMRNPGTLLESEPLCRDAWAFQERVLPTRTVQFAGDQVYFECSKHFASEDGLLLNECFHSTATVLPNDVGQDGLARWFGILWHYGTCSLSDSSDKLPALANIARAYSGILQDEYVAGLWKSSLIECLCWQSVDCKAVSEYRAPSWSWASVDGLVGVGFHTPAWKPLATIQDINVELQDNSKPFGKVKAAWIKIEAPLMILTISNTKSHTEDTILQVKDDKDGDGFRANLDTISNAHRASGALRGMGLWAVLLAESSGSDCSAEECGSGTIYHGIIATPVGGEADVLKRIGFIIAGPEAFRSEHMSSKTSITLV